jgi:hypothetical protein
MNIKPGILATVKTSQEPCLVLTLLSIEESSFNGSVKLDPVAFSGQVAVVRLPKETPNGVEHVVEQFLVEELETTEERFDREYNQMFEIQNKTKAKLASGKPSLN